MSRRLTLALLLAMLLGSCTPSPDPTPTATSPAATVALPTASPTIDVSAPEQVGRAFLSAWELDDYAKMYQLLSPTLRAGLAPLDFEQAYRAALNTTTTISVTVVPLQLGIESQTAWIDFQETWRTALFGTLEATNRLHLVEENAQWWVEWRRETIWPDLAGGNAFGVEYQIPPRANIYDREGAGLAVPSTIVTVGVVPERMADENAVVTALAQVLELTAEEVRSKYAGQPANWFIPIADISGEKSLTYDDLLTQPGVERRERQGRLYPLDGVGSHVVGWVSPIPAELAGEYRRQGYRSDALVGIAGLEAWGESILAGRNGGRLYLAGPDGSYLRGLTERQPERGRAIYATLDRALQQQAEEVLRDRQGAIVALEVDTGAVLVMASAPGFDNNIFLRPTDEWERQRVLERPDRPLLNRATQGTYPCGSVFKVVTMAAALERGAAVPTTGYHCPGYWDGLGVANRKRCWLETGHGDIDLRNGLVESCDIVFYELGMALDGLDPTILPTYGSAFGLGKLTGLRELHEVPGLMPDPEWKQETYFERWATGDSVNLSIGQGFLLVTPLQTVQMMAAVANDGTLYRSYLVDRVAAGNGTPEEVTQPQPMGQLPISEANLAIIQEALLGVTSASNGTASHRFQGLDVAVAGKTGTAEAPGVDSDPHAWFAGYFPAADPEVAMVVLAENAGEGSTVAAPIFRQLVEAYYGLPLTPLPTPPPSPTPVEGE